MQDIVEQQVHNTIVEIVSNHSLPNIVATAISAIVLKSNNGLLKICKREKLNSQIIKSFSTLLDQLSIRHPSIAHFIGIKVYDLHRTKQIEAMYVALTIFGYGSEDKIVSALNDVRSAIERDAEVYWRNFLNNDTF